MDGMDDMDDMDDLKHTKHCVYSMKYHLVFVVKYRKKCISQEIGDFLMRETKRLLKEKGVYFIQGNHDKDHIHLLIEIPPTVLIATLVGTLKNTLSRLVRKKYAEELSKYLWGDSFWTPSYYIATVGNANKETVAKYIQNQRTSTRKYKKRGTEVYT